MTLNDEDFEQLVPLYEQVYLDKYSNFNPHYTAEFLNLCMRLRIYNGLS